MGRTLRVGLLPTSYNSGFPPQRQNFMEEMRALERPRFETQVNKIGFEKYKSTCFLLLLTAAALMTHGYHPYAEDAEIYLPGVERILNPHLFPVGQEFFKSHASMTLFPNLVAGSMRITHLPFETGLFLWHVASIFLLLLACWELSCILFSSARARWGAVCLIAGLLTIPVSGTALYLMDQYLNPRNLAAFGAVFAVARVIEKKYVTALLWVVFAACVHPLMWVFPFSFCALWIVIEKWEGQFARVFANRAVTAPVGMCLLGLPLAQQGSGRYHEAAKLHTYFYIQRWEWYEWLGVVAPLALFWAIREIARKRQADSLARTCRAFAIYGLIYLVVALVVDLPAQFERLARIQPMRSLHLEYVVLFLCIGGLLGEFVLKGRAWRWLLLFAPLFLGMFVAQRALFPKSAHLEWPGRAPRNPWAQAFVWIRENTPEDAVFALDPDYMRVGGEDEIGFRCLAQRSRLADAVKDNGVVSMFPDLAAKWWAQVQLQSPWRDFRKANFAQLQRNAGVSWVVLEQPGVSGLDCPYQNNAVRVCQLSESLQVEARQ